MRDIQYDIGGDSTVGDRVREDLAIADKALFRASEGRDVVEGRGDKSNTMEAGRGSR